MNIDWMAIILFVFILFNLWRIFTWYIKLKNDYGMNISLGSWVLVKPKKVTKQQKNGLIVYLIILSLTTLGISAVLLFYMQQTYYG